MATAEFKRKMERLAREAMGDPENAELAAVLAASAAEERQRRSASAERRRQQAEGGRDADLEAVLAASLATAKNEGRRRADSAERKRRGSAERRRQQAEGGQNAHLAAVLEASLATAADDRRRAAHAAAPPPPRNRRKSVAKGKNPLARHSMVPIESCMSAGVSNDNLYRFSRDLFYCIYRDGGPLYTCDMNKYYEQSTGTVKFNKTKLQPIGGANGGSADIRVTCTAMILLFTFGSRYGHFVPYIRIHNQWYNADNEKGGLVRRAHGMPDGRTKYYNPDGTITGKLDVAFLFYVPDDLLQGNARPKKDYTGLSVFGQTKDTCGPDGLQSILMFADGFHGYFHERLYKKLVPQFNPMFWGGAHEEVTDAAVDDELRKLKGALTQLISGEGGGGGRSECTDPTKDFILSMFLRLYRIENIPEEELAGIEWGVNTTIGDNTPVVAGQEAQGEPQGEPQTMEAIMERLRLEEIERAKARELRIPFEVYKVALTFAPPRNANNKRSNVERVRDWREGR